MAKYTDHLAGGFETENTGGVLSGLLAEEDEFDRPRAVAARVVGRRRRSAAVIVAVHGQPVARSAGGATRWQPPIWCGRRSRSRRSPRKARTRRGGWPPPIDTLNSDRDRLYSRVTVLEQGLDSVTGAIARQIRRNACSGSGRKPRQSGPLQPAPVATTTQAASQPGAPARCGRRPSHDGHAAMPPSRRAADAAAY